MNFLRLLAVAVLFPSLATAKVAVMPVEATNLAPEEADAIGVMIAESLGREANIDVAGPRQVRDVVATSANAAAAAQSLGLAQYVLVRAVRLTSKVLLHVSLRDVKGDELYMVDITASSLDDMPHVADRIAKSLITRQSLEEVRDRRNVTGQETVPRPRSARQKIFGVKTAFGLPLAKGVNFNSTVALAFDFRLEAEWYFAELAVGVNIPSGGKHNNMGAAVIELSGNRYLTAGDNAPYVGLGLSPRGVYTSAAAEQDMIAPYLQVGYMLFRASQMRIYFDLKVTQEIFPVKLGNDWSSTTEVYPTEFSLGVGLGW